MTSFLALQMKGQWESNIKVWFPFMYSQKWNCAASLFPKQNYNVLSPNSYIHSYLWEIYIFPGSVCLFCCSKICRPIPIYKSVTDTWMWKLRLKPRNSQKGLHKWDFCCSEVEHALDTGLDCALLFPLLFWFALQDCAQRYIVRDRRPSTAACPACWALEPQESK